MAGDRVRVICGPTAAGKSDIAMRLALEYGAIIISADSRQIYRGFDIGTGKPTHSETQSVPHRGIDIVDPTERYSASAWAVAATGWIAEAEASGRQPLVVGGTGLYIRALFEPLFDAPPLDVRRRGSLERLLAGMTLGQLRRWCLALDPQKADLGRTQLTRAIETALLSGRRLTELQQKSASGNRLRAPALRPHYLVVDPLTALAGRIERRVDAMLGAGWVEEVRSLAAYVPADAPAWKASGYRAVRAVALEETDLSSARERIIIETRQYAKRQRTWFRHQLVEASVTRVDPQNDGSAATVERWWKELT